MLHVTEYYLGKLRFLHIHLAAENDVEGIDVYLSAKWRRKSTFSFFWDLSGSRAVVGQTPRA